jgi:hypothetical protein
MEFDPDIVIFIDCPSISVNGMRDISNALMPIPAPASV